MRVEAEVVSLPVDEPPGEDPVERCPRAERAPQQRLVGVCLLGRDERLRPPHRAQHCGVDARRRRKAGSRHAPHEAQLVVRSPDAAEQGRGPDGGPLRREPPLDDRVELPQRHARVPEQAAQDRGAYGEGEVRDYRERLARQRHEHRIALDDRDARIAAEPRLELPQRNRVELDRLHSSPCVGKRTRQRAAAGAQVEHELRGQDPSVPDELVGEGATTKSVATARPRLR